MATSLIDLTKKVQIVLDKHNVKEVRAQVAAVLDVSGSTHSIFNDGTVQGALDRLFAVAWLFDDNKQLEAWAFDTDVYQLPTVTEQNFTDYIIKNVTSNRSIGWGGTSYAPAITAVTEYYDSTNPNKGLVAGFKGLFGKKSHEPVDPVYVIFVTDGENGDQYATIQAIKAIVGHNVYIQTVGIGHSSFTSLESLNRDYDHVGFIDVKDIKNISDEALYDKLITEKFIKWFEANKAA